MINNMPGRNILVIDDDANSNQVLCDHLSFLGYQVKGIYSGLSALDYLNQLPDSELPNAILLDVLMPGMNGCEVLKSIRAGDKTKRIPVIMQSILSLDDIQDQLACSCAGFNKYIAKPFEMTQVVTQLEELFHA